MQFTPSIQPSYRLLACGGMMGETGRARLRHQTAGPDEFLDNEVEDGGHG
jgi:hypothetical protein